MGTAATEPKLKIIKVTQTWLKSDFSGSTWKWLEHDTKVTFPSQKYQKNPLCVTFEPLSGWPRKVTFESVLSHFNYFWVLALQLPSPLFRPLFEKASLKKPLRWPEESEGVLASHQRVSSFQEKGERPLGLTSTCFFGVPGNFWGSPVRFQNPSTSYRIGKPTRCKNTTQHTKCEIPWKTSAAKIITKTYLQKSFLG